MSTEKGLNADANQFNRLFQHNGNPASTRGPPGVSPGGCQVDTTLRLCIQVEAISFSDYLL
jgi:hypothetical protein